MYFLKASTAADSLNTGGNDTLGPFDAEQLVNLFKQDLIDGLTNITTDKNSPWIELATCEPLKTLLLDDETPESTDETSPDLTEQAGLTEQASLAEKSPRSKRAKKRQTRSAAAAAAAGGEQPNKKGGGANTAAYVSNLPSSVTEEQLVKHMRRCGVLKVNPLTLNPHVKIYEEKERLPDSRRSALVMYSKAESVELAIRYLDGSYIEDDSEPIKVEQASFSHKQAASQDTGGNKKPKKDDLSMKKRKLAARIEEQRLLSWAEDSIGYSSNNRSGRVLILGPCWTTDQAEMYKSTSKFYWHVAQLVEKHLKLAKASFKKVYPIRRHPKGIVCLKMSTPEEAEALIDLCRTSNIKLSPLACHPDYSTTDEDEEEMFLPIFYDGKTDLSALCIPEEPSSSTATMENPDDLDAFDRLWLMSAGVPQQDLFPDLSQATDTEQTTTSPLQDPERVEMFGDWLEAQSSDDEFVIQAETDDIET